MEAIGGRPYCHPWQFTLRDPPTEKLLLDCITPTDSPCGSRKARICAQVAPALARRMRPPSRSVRCWKGRMSTTTPPEAMECPPMLCRAPAMETGSPSFLARPSSFRSCSSASFGSVGTGQISATLVRFIRLASSSSVGRSGATFNPHGTFPFFACPAEGSAVIRARSRRAGWCGQFMDLRFAKLALRR